MSNTPKINESLVHASDEQSGLTTCCFVDDDKSQVYELSGLAADTFKKVANNETVDIQSEVFLALVNLEILQSPDSNAATAIDSSYFNKYGIRIKNFEDMYTPELEAYGFTTLTATNCASYSDSS